MAETTKEYREKLRAKLSKKFEDPFHVEVLMYLDAIHRDLHYADKNREIQSHEIISEIYQLRMAIENQ